MCELEISGGYKFRDFHISANFGIFGFCKFRGISGGEFLSRITEKTVLLVVLSRFYLFFRGGIFVYFWGVKLVGCLAPHILVVFWGGWGGRP